MRVARYRHNGKEAVGIVHGPAQEPADRPAVIPVPWPDLDTLFATDDPAVALATCLLDPATAVVPDRFLPPVASRAQLIGTGGNYADHAAEATRVDFMLSEPIVFPFLPGAVIGPEDDIVIPYQDTLTDYEVEFAVVIGKTARRLTPETAMDHVFGYTVVNDVSAREVMVREKMQLMLSKSADTFLPVGPWIVTADDIPDPYNLDISTRLNGETRQKSTTGALTVKIAQLLTVITRMCTLRPGDVVTTGTPAGVGYFREPQEFMQHGDVIVAEVQGVGRLRNPIVASWRTA